MRNPEMLSFLKIELPSERVARGVRPVKWKNLFFALKTKNHPKCSKFLGICAGAEIFSAMLLQGSLGQDVEGVGPFSLFLCFGQPPLEHFHLHLAHVHPCPIMILHVSKQFLIVVGLGQ